MTKCMTDGIETISHRVDRLTIRIDDSFDDFRNRYERAVPEFQADRFESLIEKGADWDRVVAATAENAPHDCIVYWSRDFTSLMGLMGDQGCPASQLSRRGFVRVGDEERHYSFLTDWYRLIQSSFGPTY